jgi:diguanylate cyclase (GGDEF)-like protein
MFRKPRDLSQIIFWACVFTLATMGFGTAFALYNNWTVRLETSKAHLIRSAEMGNMLVENALIVAAKSLNASKRPLEVALLKGEVSRSQAYVILMHSLTGFNEYNHSDLLGAIFWLDAQGQLVAQSGEYKAQSLDLSDQFYFRDLHDHPEKKHSVGPLLWNTTLAQSVFHLSIPLRDGQGQFAGVLVQQIFEKSITKDLVKYIDASDFSALFTHFNASPASFAYPLTAVSLSRSFPPHLLDSFSHGSAAKGSTIWDLAQSGNTRQTLVGFARSPIFGLVSFTTQPLNDLGKSFMWQNLNLLAYVLAGALVISGIFYQVHTMSLQLLQAQDSALHDQLTKLHNRRALDERLPGLLRDSMRSQQPVSLLFIDIDFFRHFNENFGHESGDIALCAVAKTLAACCRRPLDFVCRWGGEEFVAVLPQTDAHSAEKIALDMLQATRRIHIDVPTIQTPQITVSVGCVTSIVSPDNQTDDLVDMADKAMQRAKSSGRNQHCLFQAPSNFQNHAPIVPFS